MIDAATQRQNMVESQVMPSDVTDRRILQAMRALPRERFVPASMASLAYMDGPVALAGNDATQARRWMLAPRVLGKLLQLADIDAGSRVLDIGCGTGYATAVLAAMAGSVIGLECSPALAEQARANLAALKIANAKIVIGELPEGDQSNAPYDAIVIEGAVADIPEALFTQLKDGGKLVAVASADGLGKATIWRRLGRSFDARAAFDASVPVLPGFARSPEFVL